jgi:hypothetical protein
MFGFAAELEWVVRCMGEERRIEEKKWKSSFESN